MGLFLLIGLGKKMRKAAQLFAAAALLALCAACSQADAGRIAEGSLAGAAEGACRASSDCATNGRIGLEFPTPFLLPRPYTPGTR
jgi:hypothetical protein